jgi:dCMP deaminase
LTQPKVDRAKELERDRFYMGLARAVREGADCLGSRVGAVLVRDNRVVSTGFNGTPAGFRNCTEGGCVRCADSALHAEGRGVEAADPEHTAGRGLDRCICVHAEQNAFLTAARFGTRVEGTTLYTTLSPCFGCLKEAVQAGVVRVVYDELYQATYGQALQQQYEALAAHLSQGDPTRFEQLSPTGPGA